MGQGFVEALVGVLVTDVLADHVDGDLVGGIPDALDQPLPRLHPPLRGGREAQTPEDDAVDTLARERQRHFVDAGDVLRRDDGLLVDVAEERNLAAQIPRQHPIRPAQQDVGLDADRAQVADAVLGRLGLELAGRADEGDQRQVHVEGVLASEILAQLADGFQVRLALDVADGAAHLDEHDVDAALPGDSLHAVLDLVGDVRDDLHGPAQVVPPALLLDHRQVDLAGRPVVVARRHGIREPLVVSEVEIRLGAVGGDVHLPVLIGAHRAGIHVHVGVELLQRDPVPVSLEQRADGGGGQPLAERGDDAARDEDVLDGVRSRICAVSHSGALAATRRRTRSRSAGVSTPMGASSVTMVPIR